MSIEQDTAPNVRVYKAPKQPQPAQVEAESELYTDPTVVVEYRGKQYVLPATLEDADGDVLDAIDDRKISYALRGLLSSEQWRKFKATKPKVRDYNDLFDAYAKRIGLETAGE